MRLSQFLYFAMMLSVICSCMEESTGGEEENAVSSSSSTSQLSSAGQVAGVVSSGGISVYSEGAYSSSSLQDIRSSSSLAQAVQGVQKAQVRALSWDSVEVAWSSVLSATSNRICWDTVAVDGSQMANCIDAKPSAAVMEHRLVVGGLRELTRYYVAVNSDGIWSIHNSLGEKLMFQTPVRPYQIQVQAYSYEYAGLQFLNLVILNKEAFAVDSLELRVFVRGSPEQMSSCNLMWDADICQSYDSLGFNKPCGNESELRALLRGSVPRAIGTIASAVENDWFLPIPLGSTTITAGAKLRLDIRYSKGIGSTLANGSMRCDPLISAPAKKMGGQFGDWSWRAHQVATGDPVDYAGLPRYDKDFADQSQAPQNLYIAVYRRDTLRTGYIPVTLP